MYRSTIKFRFTLLVALFTSSCGRQEPTADLQSGIIKSPDFVIPDSISTRTRSLYYLFGSSNLSRKVIYYLPVQAFISNLDPGDPNSAPDIAASTMTISNGTLAGKVSTLIGGGFNIVGSNSQLEQLRREAEGAGYSISPAPAKAIRTSLSLVAEKSELDSAPDAFQVPPLALKVWSPEFKGHGPTGIVSFQAMLHPDFSQRVVSAFAHGDQLRDLISLQVDWQLTEEKLTHKAVINVDYKKVHDFISSQIGAKIFFAEVNIKDLFEKLVTCGGIDKCGVSVQWFDEFGKATDQPSPNQGLVNAVVAAQKELQDRLFTKIVDFKNELGVAGSQPASKETMFSYSSNSAHYEHQIKDRREIYYNPGAETFEASTSLILGCIKGRVNRRLDWDRESRLCRNIFGIR